ncbi:unnamed protein product [Adineta steineri]|uniref:Uncharacterized protein n=2 Tax=Adineta steineri TaxID=433720 RepID=A0A814Q7Y9_9BILA|nr:unnamed protein product [Adineta steineri]CAF1115600.1 unnamed protein product [Adineta steineri]CAF4207397.1 unnamed protein product [Adineta steineri]
MAGGLAELIFQVGLLAVQGAYVAMEVNHTLKSSEQKRSRHALAKKSLGRSSLNSQSSRAVVITSSSTNFGHDCERIVNIAFQTSQTFPKMMSNCSDIDQYLRKELAKQYSNEYFHIIIGDYNEFGFSVDGGEHFVEIEYDQYKVLIFSTKRNPCTKLDTHDANSQMALEWNKKC